MTAELEKVRNQAAGFRVQRNVALRESHALKQVVSAHNISFDVTTADTGGLAIKDGKVEGEFEYTPPTQQRTKEPTPPQGQNDNPLTVDDIRKMTPAQINERLDDVNKVLSQYSRPMAAGRHMAA